jgi:hypothetical protein
MQRVSNLEKEKDLVYRHFISGSDCRLEIPQSAIRIPQSAIQRVYRTALEKEKELTDRALKLAEIGKPESKLWGVWEFLLHQFRQNLNN